MITNYPIQALMNNELTSQDLAVEIARLHGEVLICARIGLTNAIKIGELLVLQKEKLEHGNFTDWINTNLPFSDRTARNYMRIYNARDKLKSESVSVLSDGYKLLTESIEIKGSERPWEFYYEAESALLLLNSLKPTDIESLHEYDRVSDKANEKGRIFLTSIESYLTDIEQEGDTGKAIREYAWTTKVLDEIQRGFAISHLYAGRRCGEVLNKLKTDCPDIYKFLNSNNYSTAAFNKLDELLNERQDELEVAC